MEELGPRCIAARGVTYTNTVENGMVASQNIKLIYLMTQKLHFWVLYFAMYNAHPCFGPELSGKKSFGLIFIFRNKTDYYIPGYYFAHGYRYCFLELHL